MLYLFSISKEIVEEAWYDKIVCCYESVNFAVTAVRRWKS